MRWILAWICLLPLGCRTIAPAEDFPQIPLPEATKLEPVAAVKKDGGFLLSEDDYRKTLKMIQGLRFEAETLRKIIEVYNEWAKSKKSP